MEFFFTIIELSSPVFLSTPTIYYLVSFDLFLDSHSESCPCRFCLAARFVPSPLDSHFYVLTRGDTERRKLGRE